MPTPLENRQELSSDNEQERALREADARQLVEGIIGKHAEFFADPSNRLEFIQSLDADSFLSIAQYANAKLRSEKPHELRRKKERGGLLDLMHTPSFEDKPDAFRSGYRAIQEYLAESDDSIEEKIGGVASAAEALIIWVHPFKDGNGRTARFLGKLIEEGAVDGESLIKETVSNEERGRAYYDKTPTRETLLEYVDDNNDVFGDALKASLRRQAESAMGDVDAMYHSIKLVLENEIVRKNTYLSEKEAAY